MSITYTEETILHFLCGECKKWFSIADMKIDQNDDFNTITCPHCSHKSKPIKDKDL